MIDDMRLDNYGKARSFSFGHGKQAGSIKKK